MTIRNVKLRSQQVAWFHQTPVAPAQHVQNMIRGLHNIAGYVNRDDMRQALYVYIEEIEKIRDFLIIPLADQILNGKEE